MDEKIEEIAMIALKNTMSYTCAKQIAMNFYNAGYRKESDTAREILMAISGYWDSCDCGKEEWYWRDKCVEDTLRMIAEKYGVDLWE